MFGYPQPGIAAAHDDGSCVERDDFPDHITAPRAPRCAAGEETKE